MFKRIFATLWGNFESWDEIKKFGLLGFMFGLILATYWALRPIKDSIFAALVGVDYQPLAKWLSLIIIVPLVILYGKLIDKFPRQRVFYILTIVYALIALIFYWFLSHPVYGLTNTVESPTRILGWLWYVYVESFGSLIVALFWAFTADITTEDAAKRGFPMISLLGQTGNILGPLFLEAKKLGFETSAPILLIIAAMTFSLSILMWIFLKVTPKSQLVGYHGKDEKQVEKEEEPGFAEGLKLLFTQPYLLGISLIIIVYEIIVTVFDFQLKYMSKQVYPLAVDHAAYLNHFAVTTGIVSMLCVLFGINNIQRRLGMLPSLILMPILTAFAVVGLKLSPSLTVVFWIMVAAKAVNYALNQPTLKQLYIPTTKETRYKAQAWIEMFGSRGSKAAGSGINGIFTLLKGKYGAGVGLSMFLTISSGISLSMIIVWLFVVVFVSKTYNKAIQEKRVVC